MSPLRNVVLVVPASRVGALRVVVDAGAKRRAANEPWAPPLIPERRQNGYIIAFFLIALLIFGARVLGLLP